MKLSAPDASSAGPSGGNRLSSETPTLEPLAANPAPALNVSAGAVTLERGPQARPFPEAFDLGDTQSRLGISALLKDAAGAIACSNLGGLLEQNAVPRITLQADIAPVNLSGTTSASEMPTHSPTRPRLPRAARVHTAEISTAPRGADTWRQVGMSEAEVEAAAVNGQVMAPYYPSMGLSDAFSWLSAGDARTGSGIAGESLKVVSSPVPGTALAPTPESSEANGSPALPLAKPIVSPPEAARAIEPPANDSVLIPPLEKEAVPPIPLVPPILTAEQLRFAAAVRILSGHGDRPLVTHTGGIEVRLSTLGNQGFLLELGSSSDQANFLLDSGGSVFRVIENRQQAKLQVGTTEEVHLVDDVLKGLEN